MGQNYLLRCLKFMLTYKQKLFLNEIISKKSCLVAEILNLSVIFLLNLLMSEENVTFDIGFMENNRKRKLTLVSTDSISCRNKASKGKGVLWGLSFF